MVWFKRCPRCEDGDLVEDSDIYSRFVICLQCGCYLAAEEEHLVKAAAPAPLRARILAASAS